MRERKIINVLKNISEDLKVVSLKEIQKEGTGFLGIEKYQVILNNGAIFNRERLIKNNMSGNAVIIVPVTKDNESFIIVQPRVFTDTKVSVEIPAGYIDEGETPIEAAKRELREEIGCVAEELIPLKSFYQDQGISSAYNTCFLALGCKKIYEQDLDKDEYIKYLKCSLNDLYYLVDTGVIRDANGIIAVEETKKYMKGRKNGFNKR